MKALIIGATGATGKDLVKVLLRDPAYREVVAFVRRPSGLIQPKFSEILTDFDKLNNIASHVQGDVLFCCLGTTLKDAGSRDRQKHIDYEIPLKFSAIARNNGVATLVLLSAYGASAKSRVFYSRLKGKLEDDATRLSFARLIVFRPGLLLRKNTDRAAERVWARILNVVNGVGLFRKYQPLPTTVLAEKMAKAPKQLPDGKHVVSLNDIFTF